MTFDMSRRLSDEPMAYFGTAAMQCHEVLQRDPNNAEARAAFNALRFHHVVNTTADAIAAIRRYGQVINA